VTGRAGRSFPIVSTIVVAGLVAVMIGLGIWQIGRHDQKTAAIAAMRANLHRPAVSFPESGPVPVELMFRKSAVLCQRVTRWTVEAGAAADGTSGFRYIAQCAAGNAGPGALVALGVAGRPDLKPGWNGGSISGWIVEEPDHRSVFQHATGKAGVLRPMLVADRAVAELKAPAPPSPANVPNNHMSYAVQWFLFASVAVVIYVLALRRRSRES